MTAERIGLLKQVLEQGVGAGIEVRADQGGLRTGLRAHFAELEPKNGPIFSIRPHGLRRHLVLMKFGDFSGPCIRQMRDADTEQLATARGLLKQIVRNHELRISPAQSLDEWMVLGGDFTIEVDVREVVDHDSALAVAKTAEAVMVPLMASMAELIGYDEWAAETHEMEGTLTEALVRRRERSRRNRYLCLAIHGNRCTACGLSPADLFGATRDFIEVHHLEPVSCLQMPRPYDPSIDLVPLCPNCHRLIHTRKPNPFTLDELKEMLASVRS